MSHIAMIFGLAPALAPIVGGWLLGIGSWRGIFWFLVGFGVVILLLVIFALAETHPPELRSKFDAPHAGVRAARGVAQPRRAPAGVHRHVQLRRHVPLHLLRTPVRAEAARQGRAGLLDPVRAADLRPGARLVGQWPARRTDERTQAGVPRLPDQPRRRAGEPGVLAVPRDAGAAVGRPPAAGLLVRDRHRLPDPHAGDARPLPERPGIGVLGPVVRRPDRECLRSPACSRRRSRSRSPASR